MEIKILIAGDSFSSECLADSQGWAKKIAQNFSVTNVSQPGIGQYKILKNLGRALESQKYDLIIVSHTSPNRVHCVSNPLYDTDSRYHLSDLIFSDVEHKMSKNAVAKSMFDYFCLAFDPAYHKYVHGKCCEDIVALTKNIPTIHMTNFDWTGLYQFDQLINFYELWLQHKGPYQHYDQIGNDIIYNILVEKIRGMKLA